MNKIRNSLANYSAGKFNPEQLTDLVASFSLVADASFLMSQRGQQIASNVLGPLLHNAQRTIQLEWNSYVFIESAALGDQEAKTAFNAIRFLCKQGLLRIVGSPNGSSDPAESMIELLSAHTECPICLLTLDGLLASRVKDSSLSHCVCVRAQDESKLFLYSGFNSRLASLCANS